MIATITIIIVTRIKIYDTHYVYYTYNCHVVFIQKLSVLYIYT